MVSLEGTVHSNDLKTRGNVKQSSVRLWLKCAVNRSESLFISSPSSFSFSHVFPPVTSSSTHPLVLLGLLLLLGRHVRSDHVGDATHSG